MQRLSRVPKQDPGLSDDRYRLLVESVSDYAIFLLDPNGFIESWNPGAQRYKGYTAEEAIGKHFSIFYTQEDVDRRYPEYELQHAFKKGRFEDEGWRVRKDGSRFWANVVITRLNDPSGRHVGFAKVTRDLTHRMRLEEKLRQANEDLERKVRERTTQLQEALQARDEFMSIISHELRTPVTSLKLQVQTAERQLNRGEIEKFNQRSAKLVTGAGRQLDRLAKLIDDMLDVSRISMDRLAIIMEPMDLSETVRETAERFDEQLRAVGCDLTLHIKENVMIRADRMRVEQVISNLLSNAIKYAPGNPVTITLKREESKAVVQVQDQGAGISLKDQARVFQRFERAVSPGSISGMGLGLFICRKIVEKQGGQISVNSQPGVGSTFSVVFPSI